MEPVTIPARSARRPPWTVRVASWSARHRWVVAGAWFVVTIGLFVASLAAGGTRSVEAVSNDERSKYEAGEAYVVWSAANASVGQQAPASQQFLMLVSSATRTVDDPAFRAVVADLTARLKARQSTVGGVNGPVFEQLVDPTTAPPDAGLVSADRTTVRIVARVPGDGAILAQRLQPVPALVTHIKARHPDYAIHVLNNTLTNDEISELINGGLDRSLLLTIPLTFLILLIAFGALVAAVIPLVLAVTALLAAFGNLGIYSQAVAAVSPYANQLVVLIGLAVAVDYSLFMVTRFRTERLRRGKESPRIASIEASSATAGRAVFFSGLAVMISIGGLFLLDDPLFRSMAVGTISVILVAVIGSLPFLPATLAILGDRVNRLRLPIVGRDRPEGSGVWAVLVRAVMRRPVIAALATAAILVAIALPVVRLHMGQADFTSFPDSLDGVQAVNLLNEKWPSGTDLDLSVVVTRADQAPTKVAIDRMTAAVLAIPGLSGPPKTITSSDGHVAFVNYLMSGGSNDIRNQNIVRQVRGAVVLTLSFLLLLVAFRSIVIPIKAILLNLLSTGAAFGLLVVVFQEGALADVLGFKPGPIEGFIPVFVFTILFGLSMDYHVFILTRIKEARDHGLSSNEAVARGIATTSGTITSAAAIMVVVFGVFVTLPLVIIKQLGFGLAIAVLIDATVVRSILLPATMRLLGEWNWWLPRWLGWLPHVTIEGEVDELPTAPTDGPAAEEPARA